MTAIVTMTEAELAIEEKLRKKREEQEQIWQEYLEQREKQRQKEEDDLRKLKERQVSTNSRPLVDLIFKCVLYNIIDINRPDH